jgi:uncharacterized membrane protein YdbT with pleckstrin-like domain
MGYVDQQLMQGERIMYRAKLTSLLFVGPSIFIVIGVVFALAEHLRSVAMILLPIALVALLATYVRYRTSEFAVTDRRVIIKTGLIGRRTLETQLSKVEGVGVDQSISGRVFGYGKITVKGTGGTSEPFAMIAHPMRFRKAVQEMASRYATAYQAPASPATQDDVVGKLERLSKLRDSGALSPEEFDQQKAQVLETSR